MGFLEGDGSFYYEKHKDVIFLGIKQTGNKDLLHGIKEFLIKLIKDKAVIDNINNSIRIDLKEKGMFLLSTNNIYLIEFVIIPLLDDLTWHTKKYLDYCD